MVRTHKGTEQWSEDKGILSACTGGVKGVYHTQVLFFQKRSTDEKVEASNHTCIAEMKCSLPDCDFPDLSQDGAKLCSWHTTGETPGSEQDVWPYAQSLSLARSV